MKRLHSVAVSLSL